MNSSISKKRHIAEANRSLETRMMKNILMEQTVPLMTVLANPAALGITGADNTDIIYLTQRDKNGKVIPGSKYSYRVRGKYMIVGFDISLRKVQRMSNGDLVAEAFPKSGTMQGLLKKLVPQNSRTSDNWLKVRVPGAKINEAVTMLRQEKGSKATLDAGGGVKITLELVQ